MGFGTQDSLPHNLGNNLNKMLEKINTFTINGFDIEILYKNGFLAYTFEYDKKPYGQKVKVKSKSVIDITSATFVLIENALETYKQLTNK